MTRLLILAVLLLAPPAMAQSSCADAAAQIGAEPGVRVVAVEETSNGCRIRVIEQRSGERPRSRVIKVRL